MIIEKPDPELAAMLETIGLSGLQNIELDDDRFMAALSHVSEQHGNGLIDSHTPEQLRNRAICRCAWDKYGLPELKSGAKEKAIEDAKNREVSNVHTLLRQLVEADLAAVIGSASTTVAEKLDSSSVDIRRTVSVVGSELQNAIAQANKESRENTDHLIGEHRITSALSTQETSELKKELLEQMSSMSSDNMAQWNRLHLSYEMGMKYIEKALKVAFGLAIGALIILLVIAIFSIRAHAQIDVIQFRNAANATVRTYTAPFKIQEGTGITFTLGACPGPTCNFLVLNAAAGSGTVTNFSAGTLSPLFTTSVANPTTTPALSFSLSSATADTVFMGSATPSYVAVNNCGDSSHALSYNTTTHAWGCQSITGVGTTVEVNGAALAAATGNLNDTTPAAAASNKNVTWQKDALTPTNISAQMPFATATVAGLVPTPPNNTTTFFRGDASFQTLNCASLTDGGSGGCAMSTAAAGQIKGTLPTVTLKTMPCVPVTQQSNTTLNGTNPVDIVGATCSIAAGDLDVNGQYDIEFQITQGSTTTKHYSVCFDDGSSAANSCSAGTLYAVNTNASVPNLTAHVMITNKNSASSQQISEYGPQIGTSNQAPTAVATASVNTAAASRIKLQAVCSGACTDTVALQWMAVKRNSP